MAGCNIGELFDKYADRLICMDFIDGKYAFAREDLHPPNGRIEKAGSQNATFMLSNRDLGDGEIDFPRLMRDVKRVQYKEVDYRRRSLYAARSEAGFLAQYEAYSRKVAADFIPDWFQVETLRAGSSSRQPNLTV